MFYGFNCLTKDKHGFWQINHCTSEWVWWKDGAVSECNRIRICLMWNISIFPFKYYCATANWCHSAHYTSKLRRKKTSSTSIWNIFNVRSTVNIDAMECECPIDKIKSSSSELQIFDTLNGMIKKIEKKRERKHNLHTQMLLINIYYTYPEYAILHAIASSSSYILRLFILSFSLNRSPSRSPVRSRSLALIRSLFPWLVCSFVNFATVIFIWAGSFSIGRLGEPRDRSDFLVLLFSIRVIYISKVLRWHSSVFVCESVIQTTIPREQNKCEIEPTRTKERESDRPRRTDRVRRSAHLSAQTHQIHNEFYRAYAKQVLNNR